MKCQVRGVRCQVTGMGVGMMGWIMQRCIEKELLDELAPEDARAIRSRRDLRRLNFFMGNAGILARALDGLCPRDVPLRIAEAGAGDGVSTI